MFPPNHFVLPIGSDSYSRQDRKAERKMEMGGGRPAEWGAHRDVDFRFGAAAAQMRTDKAGDVGYGQQGGKRNDWMAEGKGDWNQASKWPPAMGGSGGGGGEGGSRPSRRTLLEGGPSVVRGADGGAFGDFRRMDKAEAVAKRSAEGRRPMPVPAPVPPPVFGRSSSGDAGGGSFGAMAGFGDRAGSSSSRFRDDDLPGFGPGASSKSGGGDFGGQRSGGARSFQDPTDGFGAGGRFSGGSFEDSYGRGGGGGGSMRSNDAFSRDRRGMY